jgi:branched-chain amino acid aminotransferase
VREAGPGELGFEVLEEVLAGEAFLALSGSVRNLVPVVFLDGQEIEPGPITRAAIEVFDARRRELIDP